MAGFDDLVTAALPYLAAETIQATVGTTWRWDYDLYDSSGAPVDLTTGFTGAATIRNEAGTELAAPTVSFPAVGRVRCLVTAAASVSVPAGEHFHEVTLTRTSDSVKIIAVGARDSRFVVKPRLG